MKPAPMMRMPSAPTKRTAAQDLPPRQLTTKRRAAQAMSRLNRMQMAWLRKSAQLQQMHQQHMRQPQRATARAMTTHICVTRMAQARLVMKDAQENPMTLHPMTLPTKSRVRNMRRTVMMADTMMTTRDALKAEIRLMDGATKPGNAARRT